MSPLQKIMFGLLFPLLFCGVGFFFAKKGFSYYKTKIDKKRKCLSYTTGKIVDIESMRVDKRRTYFPTYEYVVGDKTIRVETKFGTTYCQYRRGDKVKIFYDENNPEFSYIDGYKQDNVTAIGAIMMGSMAILSGLFVLFFVWVA